MKRSSFALAAMAIAVIASLALAACGGGDDNGSSDDQDQITQAINAAATSGDTAACTKYQTAKFTQQTSGEPGQSAEQAVASCQKDAENTAADSVEVTDIEVDGDNATAKAKATGSTFDGQTLDVALVKEGDQWKLDDFKGFVDFDKDAMITAFRKQLESEPDANPQAVNCVVQQFQAASDEQVEGFFTGNSGQAEQQLFGPCSQFFQGN
jgi:hypothetical protein